MPKRLYRSKRERVVAGVCGGIAEYIDVDPTLIRIAWVVFILMGGAGLLAYFIAMIIIPENPKERSPEQKKEKEEYERKEYEDERFGSLIGGIILLTIGSFFLANNFGFMAWMDWTLFWPVIIIFIGLIIIISGSVRKW